MSKEIDIQSLQAWLDTNPAIPTAPPRKRTLMDIMGIKHLENPWSDIYAFFLNVKEEHGFGDTFIRVLEQLLGLEENWMTPTHIVREFVVRENKRIDILLTDEVRNRAIIIENKVYHVLNNDLGLYYKTITSLGYETVGVVLSVYRLPDHEHFKDITHKQYIEKVQQEVLRSGLQTVSIYQSLFESFMYNIQNLSRNMTREYIDFFFQNFRTIDKIHTIYDKVTGEYKKSLSDKLNLSKINLDTKINGDWIYLSYKGISLICLTLFHTKLWKERPENEQPYVTVILELQDKALKKVRELERDNDPQLNMLKEKYMKELYLGDKLHDKPTWRHFASWDIPIPENCLMPDAFAKYLKDVLLEKPAIYNFGLELLEIIK